MTATLKAAPRSKVNKTALKRLRASGSIPAVVYGQGGVGRTVTVDAAELRVLLAEGNRTKVIDLVIEGESAAQPVFIKEIVRDVIRRDVTHLDFQSITSDSNLVYNVPVKCVGTPVGVKMSGGTLQLVQRAVKIRCKPENMIDELTIDVSSIEKGAAAFVRDIDWKGGVILTPAGQAVAVVQ